MPGHVYTWHAFGDLAMDSGNGQLFSGNPGGMAYLSSPSSGGQALPDRLTTLAAYAAGFDTVAQVDFIADGAIIGSDSTAPFELVDWSVPQYGGSHSLSVSVQGTVNGTAVTRTSLPVSVDYPLPPPSIPTPQAFVDVAAADEAAAERTSGIGTASTILVYRDKIVRYARNWTCACHGSTLHNPKFRYFPDVDCTNFISQSLRKGGWLPNWGVSGNYEWWYRTKHTTTTTDDSNSPSWASVNDLYWFMIHPVNPSAPRATTTSFDKTDAHNSVVLPGDVIFLDDNSNPGYDHMYLITSVTWGPSGYVSNVYVSAHTKHREDEALFPQPSLNDPGLIDSESLENATFTAFHVSSSYESNPPGYS